MAGATKQGDRSRQSGLIGERRADRLTGSEDLHGLFVTPASIEPVLVVSKNLGPTTGASGIGTQNIARMQFQERNQP